MSREKRKAKKEAEKRLSTRQFIGAKEITDYSLVTYGQGELVYFIVKPTNISVLSESSVGARIYALMTVLKGVAEIEMLCLNSRESFEDNKRFLKSQMEQEENPVMEMMFSAGRSRRISMVPIIQSFAQLEKNYGKEGSSIIIDNCQDILFGGFAPNSESAEILSKALGNRTVLSGSISRGKNDPSQSLQMMSRPLMAPEELKTLPKGNFILAKTGVCPMKTRLPLFLKWGIRFEEVYEVPEQAAREVVYADRLELEEEIVRRSDFDEEDLWRGSVESGKLEEASFLGGKAHGETAKEKQHKAATRRLPLRTD